MYNLPDLESQRAALLQPLDPELHTLIAGRMKDALALELGELTHIVVVQPHDTEADLIDALGFSPMVSRIDGIHLEPDWDWFERHGGYFEIVWTVGNSGFAYLVFVQDGEGVLPDLLTLCREGRVTCS